MANELYDYMCEQSFTFTEINNKTEETHIQTVIDQLSTNCKKLGYEISVITSLNGNCFFEVLVDNGLAKDIDSMRKITATLLINFKDVIGFLSTNSGESLETLFYTFNEINYFKNDKGDIEIYTYENMCKDILMSGSWEKIPTQLIMMVISKCFNIKFIIINSNDDNIIEINENKENFREIGLGFLPEFHYVGIKKIG